MKHAWKYYLIALAVLLIDQAVKLWVHFSMELGVLGQIKLLGNWFKLCYTLNPGMAFGIQFGFKYDKVLLTITRIIATVMIGRHVWQLAKSDNIPSWLLWGWSLVLGGAAGNGIDSIFYGALLNNVPYEAPIPWFYGQVIDMFYIDIWTSRLPSWVPWFGGQCVTCFPIFNLADVTILVGIALVLFSRRECGQQPAESASQQNNDSQKPYEYQAALQP